jgi:hypothetical protein
MFFVFLSEEALDLEFTEKLLHNQQRNIPGIADACIRV